MFGVDFIWEALIGYLRGWLFKNTKAAQYAKYALRVRDYLLLLFPIEMYPTFQTADPVLESVNVDSIKPVPVEAVKSAAKKSGFNLPFIKGM